MAKAKYEIKYNSKAFTDIRNGQAICSALTQAAAQVASSANGMASEPGATYISDAGRPGKKRAHALIYTGNFLAMLDNARNNTLLKALKGRAK